MSRYYAGVDLAARSCWICVVNAEGEKQVSRKVANDPEKIGRVLKPFLGELSAVVESTFNWYWIVDVLEDLGAEVKLAHPLYIKAIACPRRHSS